MDASNSGKSRHQVLHVRADRDAVQKKTFTKWINSHLMKAGVKVNDLYEDLRDGKYLQMLLEMFTGIKLKMEKGRMRVHQLTNLNKLMVFLGEQKIDTLNITSTDILDGNPKLTLALVWRLILHYQLSNSGSVGLAELKQVILEWCQNVTEGYDGVQVTNFTTSWKSGLALNAIINRYRPDLIDYDSLDQSNQAGNLENAFEVAEKEIGVPKLLDVEDLLMAVPDERSVLTYISFYIKAFPDEIPPRRSGFDPVNEKLTAYEKCARPLMAWLKEKTQLILDAEEEPLPELLDEMKDLDVEGLVPQSEVDVKASDKSKVAPLYKELQDLIAERQSELSVPDGLHVNDIDSAWEEFMTALEARRSKIQDHTNKLETQAKLDAENQQLQESWNDYEDVIKPLLLWISAQLDELSPDDLPSNIAEVQTLLDKISDQKTSSEWKEKSGIKDNGEGFFKKFLELNSTAAAPMDIPEDLHFDTIETAWQRLMVGKDEEVARVSDHLKKLQEAAATEEAEESWEQYEEVAAPLMSWIGDKQGELDGWELPQDLEAVEALHCKLQEEAESEEWKSNAQAKDTAKERFGVFEDLNSHSPNPVSVKEGLHYRDDIEKAWSKLMDGRKSQMEAVSSELARMQEQKSSQDKADGSWDQYEAVASPLMSWIQERQSEIDNADKSKGKEELEALLDLMNNDEDWKLKFPVKRNSEDLFRTFQDLNTSCPAPLSIKDGLHYDDDVLKAWNKLMAGRDDLISAITAQMKRMQNEEAETEKATGMWDQYAAVAVPLMAWIEEKQTELDEQAVPSDLEAIKVYLDQLKEEKTSDEWKSKSGSKDTAEELFVAFKKQLVYLSTPLPIKEGLHFFDDMEKAWNKLMEDKNQHISEVDSNLKRLQDEKAAQEKSEACWQAYEDTASPLMAWIQTEQDSVHAVAVPEDLEELKALVDDLQKKIESPEWTEQKGNKEKAGTYFSEFLDANSQCPEPVSVKDGLHYDDDVQKAWDALMTSHEAALHAAQEQLAKRLQDEKAKQERAEESWQLYVATAGPLSEWISKKDEELKSLELPASIEAAQELQEALTNMKDSEDWATQAGNLEKADKLFKDFEVANSESKTPVSVTASLHMSDDIQPAWDSLMKTLDDVRDNAAADHLVKLKKKAELDHALEQVEIVCGSLEDIKDKVETFQADRGEPSTRDNMKITVGELQDELKDWHRLHEEVKQLCGELDQAPEHFPEDARKSISEMDALPDIADVLAKRITASDDALVILGSVDEIMEVSFGKAFEENYDTFKEKVDRLNSDHAAYQAKQSEQLGESGSNPHDLEQQVNACSVHWKDLCSLLSSDVGKPVEDADAWLQSIEDRLEKHSPLLHRSNDVEDKQLSPLKILSVEVSSRVPGILDIAKRGETVTVTDGGLDVKMLAASLPQRLQAISAECENRVKCAQLEVASLSQYESQLNSLKNWLAWAEGELDSLRRRHDEPKAIQGQVAQCQKLLSDVLAHEPYVSATSKHGDESVDIAKNFDTLVDEYRTALEGSTVSESQTLEAALDEEYKHEKEPIARDAIPSEVGEVKQQYDNLVNVFQRRLLRLESRLEKATHVQGLFDKLKAFLAGSEETSLLGESSLLPADVDVLEHHIGEVNSLTEAIEDSFVILDSATSALEDFETDVEEDEISSKDGDQTDSPGVLSVLGSALRTLRDKSANSLLLLSGLKTQLDEFNDVCGSLSEAMGQIEAEFHAEESASCDVDVLEMQVQHTANLMAKLKGQEELVDKARTICAALVARQDLQSESRESLERQLRSLQDWYSKFVSLSTIRMDQLQKTKACLSKFTDLHRAFCEWLGTAEVQAANQSAISVDCSALQQQDQDSKAFMADVAGKKPDLDELITTGEQLVDISSKTASELYTQPSTAEAKDSDVAPGHASAADTAEAGASQSDTAVIENTNWVQTECQKVPQRYDNLAVRSRQRVTDVERMLGQVKIYTEDKGELDTWMTATTADLDEIEASSDATAETLQDYLAKVQDIVVGLDSRESGKDSTLDKASEILDDYKSLLGEAQEAFKTAPVDDEGEPPETPPAPALDEASRKAAAGLEQDAADTADKWKDLRQRAARLDGHLSARLDVVKDASTAMDGLAKSLAELSSKVDTLSPISCDRKQYDEQQKETELLQLDLAKIKAQFSVLDNAAEVSPDLAAARQNATEQCDTLEKLMSGRLSAFEKCGELLGADESLGDWMDEKDSTLEHLLASPSRAAIEELLGEMESKGSEVQALRDECSAVCAEFTDHVDSEGYSNQSERAQERLRLMKEKAEGLLKGVAEREGVCERHQQLNNQLEEFNTWLQTFKAEDHGVIGLELEPIEEVCALRKTQQEQLDGKLNELKQFQASDAFADLDVDSLDGDTENAITKAAEIVDKYDEAASAAKQSLDNANSALAVAQTFEEQFEELCASYKPFELSLKAAEPLTGEIEHTQEQLEKFNALQKEISDKLPHVNEVCDDGDRLKQMSEVDDAEKDSFAESVEEMRSRWENLLAECSAMCDKYGSAADKTREFVDDHLNPISAWLNDKDDMLRDTFRIGGDATVLADLQEKFDNLSEEIKEKEADYLATMQCGESLMADVLDDKSFTTEQLEELTQIWNDSKRGLATQLQRLADAKEKLAEFVLQLPEVEAALDEAMEKLEAMEEVSHTDLSTAEAQEQEILAFWTDDLEPCSEATSSCLELCQQMIDSSPADRQDDLISVHADLSDKLASLQQASNARKLKIKAALLELRGLADTIELLETSLDDTEKELSELERLNEEEQNKKKSEIEKLQSRLASLRKELDDVRPELEALIKVKQQREQADAEAAAQSNQMQTVGIMETQFNALMKRSLQLSANLEDAMTAAIMFEDENFDVEGWREKFVGWLDENDINVAEVFRSLDVDGSEDISRDELFEGLANCGFPMKAAHIDQVVDHFDEDRSGAIDKWEFLIGLRPERRVQFAKEAKTDDEKINHAVRTAVSRCTCSKQFRLDQINNFTYRFGDSQLKRMVRILRTNVMVRVGGGWEDLNAFLNKHDPCRATGRTNLDLRRLPKPGQVNDIRVNVKSPTSRHHPASKSGTASARTSVSHGTKRESSAHSHTAHSHAAHSHATHSHPAHSPSRKHGMVTRSQEPTSKKTSTDRKPVVSSGYGITRAASGRSTTKGLAAPKDTTDGAIRRTSYSATSSSSSSASRTSSMRKTTSASSLPAAKKTSDISSPRKSSDATRQSTTSHRSVSSSGYGNVSSSGYGRPSRSSLGDASKEMHRPAGRSSISEEPGKSSPTTRPSRLSTSDRSKTSPSGPYSPKIKKSSTSAGSPKTEYQPSALTKPRAGPYANPTISSSEKVRSRSPSVSPSTSPQTHRKSEEINPESRLMMPTQSSLNKTSPKVGRRAKSSQSSPPLPPASASSASSSTSLSPESSGGTLEVSPTSSVMQIGRTASGSGGDPTSSPHS
ncbi:microtubule-actin cross-linking factor 1-like isoform X3 [Sycon ciliatum]|uniref:microtubule-actin cross-linking factor 1-like isoform X3 n=1 Tax=Sycon ciliatum TaxID=27933 RepID=UPI0031F63B7E